MNADLLLAHYERVADAPNAVPCLRRFILDLAVRGKLVPQDPDDEPASELLKRIAAEKARLVKAGKIAKLATPNRIAPSQHPFGIPKNWEWVRLGDMLTKLTDGTHHSPPSGPNGDFKYITAKNIKNEGVLLDDVTYVSRTIHEEIFARCNPERGDILYIKDGATTGIATVNDLEEPFSMLSSVALLKLPLCLSNRLTVEFLRSPFFYDQMRGFMKGAAITRVTLKRMGPALFPLPPLPEQHRIVVKIDELMALCDQLEAARVERERTRDRLAVASLARLNAPDPDPSTFANDARFAFNNLAAVTARPDQIKPLRQTILNLAVHGRLVAQNSEDKPAQKLLKSIAVQKAHQVNERKIRLSRKHLAVGKVDVPAGLPRTWVMCPLGNIALVSDPNPSHRYPPYDGGTVPILSTQEFKGIDGWNPTSAKLVTEEFFRFQRDICRFSKGDIVFARKGRLGLPRFLPDLERFTFSHTVFIIKPLKGVFPPFLLWSLRRAAAIDWLTKEMNQNTGVPTLGKDKTERLPIALPPLAEQRRIVAKVDELMSLCDRLEASLAAGDDTRRRLLDALLHEALTSSAGGLKAA